MHASAQTRYSHRPARNFVRPQIRARLGLAMRRDMDFGPLGDVADLLRAQGLTLAPMSTGEASLVIGGVTILPMAKVGDFASGAVKGLVLPGGKTDAEGDRVARELVEAACAKGVPILALGSAVTEVLEAAGRDPAPFAEAPAVLLNEDGVAVLADRDAIATAASRIG